MRIIVTVDPIFFGIFICSRPVICPPKLLFHEVPSYLPFNMVDVSARMDQHDSY